MTAFDPGLSGLIPELRWRGMFHAASEGLEARLASGKAIAGYNGFDPSDFEGVVPPKQSPNFCKNDPSQRRNRYRPLFTSVITAPWLGDGADTSTAVEESWM